MNQNFFNFPTSWVAEMNKQAQPKVAAILQPTQGERIEANLQARIADTKTAFDALQKLAPTPAKPKGRPVGSKNKPKAK